jgi:hypothetical protein
MMGLNRRRRGCGTGGDSDVLCDDDLRSLGIKFRVSVR